MTPPDHKQTQMSDTDAPAGMSRVGAELREVRERVGWKLPEVAAELRIREEYLEAIETGRLGVLPGPVYQIGFIRTYARTLGLDPEEILRRYRAEGAGEETKPPLSFLAPVPDRAVPTGAIVLVGVVLLLVGYGLWFLHTENERSLAASVPSVPAQLAPLALPPAVTPSVPPVAAAPPVAAVVQNKIPATAVQSATPAAVAASQTPAAPAASPSPVPVAATGAKPAAPPAAGRTILATADSWVEVKDATGNILFSRLMHAGDSWPVPDLPGLVMTAGNAGGTEISDNGTAGPPLGSTGSVLHNYMLTPGSPPAIASPPGSPTTPPAATTGKGTN